MSILFYDFIQTLSYQEISVKFHLLTNPVIGEKRVVTIEQRVSQVDETDFDLEHLLELVLSS